ncbi:MFS transporter [Sneathiella chungangensis]|uniref:MFS transporter n=1 Tax=Sneathiella chungangensis TaxID=1418234 RepID=A0A845MJ46_9PROT|nr:MFS transporter [Sneathiella chungangensis]MZR23014.1 MFS transporter [Sneathiella chungangensis]
MTNWTAGQKWRSVLLLALCQVMALSLWFSATAVIPILKSQYGLSGLQASLFSSAVAIGFVSGTLVSAVLSLADRIPPRTFFASAALIAASANLAIIFFDPTSAIVVVFRFITGVCMAGIYPVGMKMVSTWAKRDTGLLVGLLVGALTIGSAFPHILNLLDTSGLDWKLTLMTSSLLAVGASGLIAFVTLGSDMPKAPPFDPSLAFYAWTYKPLRLANFGYFGHMWELYAMWAWIGLFLFESFRISNLENGQFFANLGTFATIAAGGLGSLIAGLAADRFGRTTVTITAMAFSGTCSVAVGFLFGGSPLLLILVCLIWGISIVADSAQFSTCIIELSPRNMIGTMLTIQTCIGFLISLATIHLIPLFIDLLSWHYAFAPLAIGPLLGVIAMAKLRAQPEAMSLANGHR